MGDNNKEQLVDIVKPHDHDVLSGRGNYVNHHAGNENFRKLWVMHIFDSDGIEAHLLLLCTTIFVSYTNFISSYKSFWLKSTRTFYTIS